MDGHFTLFRCEEKKAVPYLGGNLRVVIAAFKLMLLSVLILPAYISACLLLGNNVQYMHKQTIKGTTEYLVSFPSKGSQSVKGHSVI